MDAPFFNDGEFFCTVTVPEVLPCCLLRVFVSACLSVISAEAEKLKKRNSPVKSVCSDETPRFCLIFRKKFFGEMAI